MFGFIGERDEQAIRYGSQSGLLLQETKPAGDSAFAALQETKRPVSTCRPLCNDFSAEGLLKIFPFGYAGDLFFRILSRFPVCSHRLCR